jgi:hypothetical protein
MRRIRQLAWICTLKFESQLLVINNEQMHTKHGGEFLRCAKGPICLPEGLNVVGTVGTAGEIRQVELNLVPALVETHGHGADEGLHAGGALVVRGAETATHVFVIEDLDLESEVLLQL